MSVNIFRTKDSLKPELMCSFISWTTWPSVENRRVGILTVGVGGGDREAGAREKRGREGYGRWGRKGQEEGVLRGWEAGGECKALNFSIY